MVRVVGIGDYAVSRDTQDILMTFSLSSCVALTAYDPINKVLGMVHIALPGRGSNVGTDVNPAYYVDTAIPLLIKKMCNFCNSLKNNLEIKVYGGAESIRETDTFKIGPRNVEMVKSILKKMNMAICHSDTGGKVSRSLIADVATGTVKVKYQPLNI